jgi:predicted MFS family arabinose efflux permease
VATAGAGVGILASGFLVPRVTAGLGLLPWQLIWLLFAAAALLIGLLAAALLRDRPAELGLRPYGRASAASAGLAAAGGGPARAWPILLHLGVVYALFAATMLTYTTFIVTTMVDELSIAPATAGLLWAGVGGLSIFSGPLFGAISDRLGHRAGILSALLVQAVAYGLVAAGTGMAGLYLSIALFGLTAWSLPTIVAAASGDYFGPEKAAAGFAILTLMFALGQVLGPAGAGILADASGGFALSYAVAAGLNVLALLLALFLRPPPRTNP